MNNFSKPSESTSPSALTANLEPLSAVKKSNEFQQATEKHNAQCEQVKAKTKQDTNDLLDMFHQDEEVENAEIILVSEKKKSAAEKKKSAAEKKKSAAEKEESTAETLADSKKLNEELAAFDGWSQDAQDLLQGANCLKKCGWKKSCEIKVASDVKDSSFSEDGKRSYSEQTGTDLDSASQAQANLEKVEDNEMLEQLTNDEYWKQRYERAQSSLSHLFYPNEMDESGNPKLIKDEQFQTIVHALMSSPDIQDKIQTLAQKDRKIQIVYEQYSKREIFSEAQGYALLQEVIGLDGIADRVSSEKFSSTFQVYQQKNKSEYQDQSKLYTGAISTTNLTRILTEEMISAPRDKEQGKVTWEEIRKRIENDGRINKRVKITLYRNVNSIILTGKNPKEYLEGKSSKIIREEDGKRVTVDSILSGQKLALQQASDSTLNFVELPSYTENAEVFLNQKENNLFAESVDWLAKKDKVILANIKKEVVAGNLDMVDPNLRKPLAIALAEADPSYAQTFATIQQERIERGQEPLFSPEEMEEVMQYANIKESGETIFSSDMDLHDYDDGTLVSLPGDTKATVYIDKSGERFLNFEGILMSPKLADNIEDRTNIIKDAEITGVTFLTPEQQLNVFRTINDALRKGWPGVPQVHLDLTDGINSIAERDAYVLLRKFLIQAKGGQLTEIDAMFKEVGNQNEALTNDDENIREALLGHKWKEGVFQRDALMDKLRDFFEQQHNIA